VIVAPPQDRPQLKRDPLGRCAARLLRLHWPDAALRLGSREGGREPPQAWGRLSRGRTAFG